MKLMLKQYVAIQVFLATRKKASKGQSLAEYGLVLALVAVVAITALTTLGKDISTMLTGLATTISGVSTSS
jgi:Flp pilus assembly pilin Flp